MCVITGLRQSWKDRNGREMVAIELFILLSTILPLFHLFNALFSPRPKRALLRAVPEKKISVLIPCYNEEDIVATAVMGLVKTDYKNFEAIFINDGSFDDTLGQLNALLELAVLPDALPGVKAVYQSVRHKNFFVIDKDNAGKSAALNTGIQYAHADIVVTLDADSVMEKGALKVISRALADPDVVAVGGVIHIMQGYAPLPAGRRFGRMRTIMVALQMLEYLKGFYIYKYSLARQNAMAIISGAFGAFKKQVLLEVGGFRKTLGEDIDITISIQRHIHRTSKKILFVPEALCCTQCPESWGDLKRQRIRWQKGFIDCAVHHRRFLLKTVLFKSLSFHFLVEALAVGVVSCIFTLLTLTAALVLAFVNPAAVQTFLLYHAVCVAVSLLYAAVSLAVSSRYHRYPKGSWRLMLPAVLLDVLFYRYFTLLMYLGGLISYFWSRRNMECWNKVARSKQPYYASHI